MWLENVCESEDHSEKCPTCGGAVQRRAYGEMYAGAYVQDGERVEMRRTPFAGYADPIVLDPLTQYFDGGLFRMWPSEKYLSRGGKKLHRAVWESAFGDVPKGCHIHHIDSNPANNALSNLECLPAREHLSDRGQTNPGGISDLARERAKEWHKSDAGRLWHKRHAERSKGWLKWKREEKNCPVCGDLFQALVRKSGCTQIYCSNNCKATAYRRRNASI